MSQLHSSRVTTSHITPSIEPTSARFNPMETEEGYSSSSSSGISALSRFEPTSNINPMETEGSRMSAKSLMELLGKTVSQKSTLRKSTNNALKSAISPMIKSPIFDYEELRGTSGKLVDPNSSNSSLTKVMRGLDLSEKRAITNSKAKRKYSSPVKSFMDSPFINPAVVSSYESKLSGK